MIISKSSYIISKFKSCGSKLAISSSILTSIKSPFTTFTLGFLNSPFTDTVFSLFIFDKDLTEKFNLSNKTSFKVESSSFIYDIRLYFCPSFLNKSAPTLKFYNIIYFTLFYYFR